MARGSGVPRESRCTQVLQDCFSYEYLREQGEVSAQDEALLPHLFADGCLLETIPAVGTAAT